MLLFFSKICYNISMRRTKIVPFGAYFKRFVRINENLSENFYYLSISAVIYGSFLYIS
jgi:hypothetical protein